MITEWQPIMPGDKLKLKARTIYEFLRTDTTVFLGVGLGIDQDAEAADDVVAWREYDTKPLPSLIRTDAEVAELRSKRK